MRSAIMMGGKLLVIAPPPVRRIARDRVVVSRKFVTGMQRYASLWGGPVGAVLPPGRDTVNLDCEDWDPKKLGFELHVELLDSPTVDRYVAESAVVLGGPHHQLRGLSRRCRRAGIPSVYNTECTLKTRMQIVRSARARSPLSAIRGFSWEIAEERRFRAELHEAAGLQCNGTPTYKAYADLVPRRLLYFDSRITRDLVATEDRVRLRQQRVSSHTPLRLAFSGRLAVEKGVEHLVDVSRRLASFGVNFQMDILGGGPLEAKLRRRIEKAGLSERVHVRGVLDFANELVPLLSREIDLFVCCHRQGDPSCTYLETLACGVPIVGYENEAFSGLLEQADVGWGVPVDRADLMARLIERLDRERHQIARKAARAVRFARNHTFESTFQRRIEHLESFVDTAAPRRVVNG